jgi:hypothetical protein
MPHFERVSSSEEERPIVRYHPDTTSEDEASPFEELAPVNLSRQLLQGRRGKSDVDATTASDDSADELSSSSASCASEDQDDVGPTLESVTESDSESPLVERMIKKEKEVHAKVLQTMREKKKVTKSPEVAANRLLKDQQKTAVCLPLFLSDMSLI